MEFREDARDFLAEVLWHLRPSLPRLVFGHVCSTIFSTLLYGFDKKRHERLGRRGLVASSFFTALLVKRGV